jgi:molybdopterin-guanine dinucleotide biosynthesis protein A
MTDSDPVDQPFGLILAGGRARRMGGGDKVLLPLGGRCLLDHVLERFAPQVTRLALSANGDPSRFARFDLPVLPDLQPDLGPLSGIHAGLVWAQSLGASGLVTVSGDTPFLPRDLVSRLLDGGPVAYASDDLGAHPTCALWHVRLIPDVTCALEDKRLKVRDFLTDTGAKAVRFPGADSFFNINTPDDLIEAERRIARYMPSA